MKFQIPSDYLEQGCVTEPHFIYSKDVALSPYERHFLATLMAVEDKCLTKTDWDWFYITNTDFHNRSGISLNAIPKIRERLRRKGLIDYRRGYTGHATEYLILIDHYYRHQRTHKTSAPLKASS